MIVADGREGSGWSIGTVGAPFAAGIRDKDSEHNPTTAGAPLQRRREVVTVNVTPKEGLSAFVGVLATLMRDCPEEWDDSKGWCDGILHQPTGIELTFFDWNVMMHGPESMTFGLVNSIRLRLARRPVKRSIARRREVARLKALTAKLLRLRENVVSIRDTTA